MSLHYHYMHHYRKLQELPISSIIDQSFIHYIEKTKVTQTVISEMDLC